MPRSPRACKPNAIIGSSTSGLLPSDFYSDAVNPDRCLVGHPFNPVYLLPLVEVVKGKKTSQEAADAAAQIYAAIGMHPLKLSSEIPGFVADRLLEAVWRESLHMINEGVATTAEIDDAIRFGCGIRFSFMGSFLIYTLAGGDAGMKHFMAQFGPALELPWTKLKAPQLTDRADRPRGGGHRPAEGQPFDQAAGALSRRRHHQRARRDQGRQAAPRPASGRIRWRSLRRSACTRRG